MVEASCRTYVFCDECGLLEIRHEKRAFSDLEVIRKAEEHARSEKNPHPHRVTIRETWGRVDLEAIGDEVVLPIFYDDSPSISDNG